MLNHESCSEFEHNAGGTFHTHLSCTRTRRTQGGKGRSSSSDARRAEIIPAVLCEKVTDDLTPLVNRSGHQGARVLFSPLLLCFSLFDRRFPLRLRNGDHNLSKRSQPSSPCQRSAWSFLYCFGYRRLAVIFCRSAEECVYIANYWSGMGTTALSVFPALQCN